VSRLAFYVAWQGVDHTTQNNSDRLYHSTLISIASRHRVAVATPDNLVRYAIVGPKQDFR
jgi:hypothetical protein